ncbi:MAG TPA: bifunctional hydroxymethylpyrimidine kinase/phosphomethylpyrimidine kinase [Kofleriaceae bacterium]|nr:bifunctional hydroxymethylpyrimidine kinase/phosphomethylpyrimidine kinase [Kofleriaceae bacterium]
MLICAGLDPSGGAGILADARVVSELGGRPVGVVTALTVQNTTAVLETEAMSPDLIREQLEFLLSDVEVKAAKIGMIGSSEIAKAIASALALTSAPVVWDPIIHPSRGDVRFIDSLFGHAVKALVPHVALLTPNAGELAFMTGTAIASVSDAVLVGERLADRLRTSVLVKGGHVLEQDTIAESIDVLCHDGKIEILRGPRTPGGEHVHGTGCALSSAIATHLAHGAELVEACRAAKAYVASRIAAPVRPGRGAAAVV